MQDLSIFSLKVCNSIMVIQLMGACTLFYAFYILMKNYKEDPIFLTSGKWEFKWQRLFSRSYNKNWAHDCDLVILWKHYAASKLAQMCNGVYCLFSSKMQCSMF